MLRKTVVAALAALLALAAPAAAQQIPDYGANDAGGFRDVLPPGAAGTDNVFDLARFQASDERPPHWDDQMELYNGLLYASPKLQPADLGKYFKDSTFGVKPEDRASTTRPRAGVTIIRDRQYGIPHVYGATRGDVMFGAGYAGAQDRLFLMDILRNTGRARLSSFAGGSAGNREMDRTQWAIAPYTEADLQRQIDQAVPLYGDDGRRVIEDVNNYVAGINQYISEARLDPRKLPAEYAAFGKSPQDWKVTDVIATASLVGGIFGKGGGNEVRSGLALRALQHRFGTRRGRSAWRDFRSKNDPEAPTTILGKRFPYQSTSAFAGRGIAAPDRGSVTFETTGPPLSQEDEGGGAPSREAATIPDDGSIGSQLLRQLHGAPPHASNWLLVPARESASGHPIAVLGPQVGYYVPQILMELELHGPGIEARGTAFPGVNLYIQLGHGRDYAWSATTATSDNVDTFAEVLCRDDFHYLYKGQCRAMEKLEQRNAWSPSAGDDSPAGEETLTAYRTVHGIVYARGTVRGRKVAYVSARTTYFHEADSALGFSQLNDPGFVRDAASFQRAASNINFAFNWSYVDSERIAYYLSGAYPQRARGTSPDFPVLGTGEYDWVDFDPERYTMRTVPFARHPNAIDQRYLISWNNKQAPGWSAADDKWSYGPVFRSQMLEARVKRAIAGRRKMTLTQLVQAMEEPATEDLRARVVLPWALKALGRPKDKRSRDAIATLRRWQKAGGHRRDLDRNGTYDHDAAVTIMDAWWPRLVQSQFGRSLGTEAMRAVRGVLAVGDVQEGAQPNAPAYSDGWWGYVNKDLRTLYGNRKRVRGRYSRVYCGRGSRKRCTAELRASLRQALDTPRQQVYGRGECASDPDAQCFDMNRHTVASAVTVPDMPFQNRPTYQQIVELARRIPR
jgi:acyl-homoserine lactone acylase PvdQ